MSIPDVTVDQPQTYGDVPGWNDEEDANPPEVFDEILPGWDGEGRDRERQQGFAATIIQLIKDQSSGLYKTLFSLQSSHETTIRAKDDMIELLRKSRTQCSDHYSWTLQDTRASNYRLERDLSEKWQETINLERELHIEKSERLAVANRNELLEKELAALRLEAVARESILKETQKELEECKADKAAADAQFNSDHVKAMEYDKLIKRGFDNLLDENKYLAGQLAERDAQIADRDAEAQRPPKLSESPQVLKRSITTPRSGYKTSQISKMHTPSQGSRPAWK